MAEAAEQVQAEERDRTEDVADFAQGLQELVNDALNVLTAVEIVGVLELLKSEILIEGNRRRVVAEMFGQDLPGGTA